MYLKKKFWSMYFREEDFRDDLKIYNKLILKYPFV